MTPLTLRRFPTLPPSGAGVVLSAVDPALRGARTRFGATVQVPEPSDRVLKSGHNSRKIGKIVTKGRWRGFPIYTLTLEERATCPRSCAMWAGCYGNNMHWTTRWVAGAELESRLLDELLALHLAHPHGFAVRLHVLGDFYSEDYVRLWAAALDRYRSLHVFGFTARDPVSDPIGQALWQLASNRWDRFAVRFSGLREREMGAGVEGVSAAPDAIPCPAQTGRTDYCATCGLCWATTRSISFARH